MEYSFSKSKLLPITTNNNSDKTEEFVSGDSFGFYSANSLIDVYQVLTSTVIKCMDNDEELLLLWNYLKGNKKQAFIILNDNVN